MGDIQDFLAFCDRVVNLEKSEPFTLTWQLARRDGQALDLEVFVETNINEIPDQTWEIRVDHVREISLTDSPYDEPVFTRDHVLLWGYKELVSQLNFTWPPGKHESLLWDLHERHRVVTEGWNHWIPFDRYFYGHFINNRLSGATASWPWVRIDLSRSTLPYSEEAISNLISRIRLAFRSRITRLAEA